MILDFRNAGLHQLRGDLRPDEHPQSFILEQDALRIGEQIHRRRHGRRILQSREEIAARDGVANGGPILLFGRRREDALEAANLLVKGLQGIQSVERVLRVFVFLVPLFMFGG